MRKRFIAGARCPHCQQADSLALWQHEGVDVVACVACGNHMPTDEKVGPEKRRFDEKIIALFRPE